MAARSASGDGRSWAASPATAASATPGGTRYGQQVTVVAFWSGIAGDGPDGSLLFCTCAGIRGPDERAAYQRVWGWADIAAARAGHEAVTGSPHPARHCPASEAPRAGRA